MKKQTNEKIDAKIYDENNEENNKEIVQLIVNGRI